MLATEKGKKYFDAKKSKIDASLRFHEIFHCFMVLCLDFEDVNSFFMGISRRAYYYMHQFFQARFYCFESLQVCLGWEKRRVNDVAKTQKNWNIFSTSREYCILLICWSLTSWLHFLNKASTNTIERSTTWDIWTSFCLYISVLFIRPCFYDLCELQFNLNYQIMSLLIWPYQIKDSHSIHISCIWIDIFIIEMVICHPFNNIRLSFFASNMKQSLKFSNTSISRPFGPQYLRQ